MRSESAPEVHRGAAAAPLPPEERWSARWARRAGTFPGFAAAAALLLTALPVALPVLALLDLARRERFARVRTLLVAVHYLLCELGGLAASGLLWVAMRVCGTARARSEGWHHALQAAWAGALFAGIRRLFALRLALEGDAPGPGPLLVFMRHASLADTLLPALLLSRRHGLRLRYVMKRELLFDPCLDVVGNRLPNVFVRRESAQSEREIAAVEALARGLGPGEGVLIYPEGTRFSRSRRARRLERIAASGNAARLERARRLRHVLPPRTGGPLALLDAAPGADVLVVAHVGLEGVTHFRDAWRGDLIGRSIRVIFWRVPRALVPDDRAKRVEWLFDLWERVDDWIDAQHAGPVEDRGAGGAHSSSNR
jgi:1-acyl-sn-glycerol-3-phosphate acyltransferase